MAPKVFLTGVTGYIGGDLFSQLYEAHPELEYTLLVRNEQRAKLVTKKYPEVRIVLGELDSADVIEKEAAAADLIIHTAESADDVPSATAIARGIATGHSPELPGRWIHLSGTAILQWYDQANKRYGEAPLPDQTYNDIRDIDRIVSFPDAADHRNVDKIVLAVNDAPGVRTAIVAPPTIHGPGRGPGNKKSQQVNNMARFLLHNGYAPVFRPGKNEWDNVHIYDLSRLFVQLAEAALDPARRDDPEFFGPKAYYFAEGGHHVWREVAEKVAEAAHKQGFMAEPKTEYLGSEALLEIPGMDPTLALNSKGVGERARKLFSWVPHGPSLWDDIPSILAGEAEAMGIKPTLAPQ